MIEFGQKFFSNILLLVRYTWSLRTSCVHSFLGVYNMCMYPAYMSHASSSLATESSTPVNSAPLACRCMTIGENE